MKYDVIIVGAGVAGLESAIILASKGFKVAIIESKPRDRVGDKTCGDAIGVHHFEKISLEIPSNVIDYTYDGVKIYSPSEEHSIIVPGKGVSVNRIKFGQWLLQTSIDKGVDFFESHVLVDVVLKNERVDSLIAKKTGGSKVELKAEAFIDASGAKPALRTKLPDAWPIADRPYMTDFNIAYREVVRRETPIDQEDSKYALIYLNQQISPGGYWWLFPKSDSGYVINVGLGVVWNGEYNPRHNYEKFLKSRFQGEVIHSGGGIVPTRRPLPTLIWRNVGVVGDAAYTVNPVHGGGIGSSLEAAYIVSTYIGNALEAGEVREDKTWEANIKYMEAYGAKQAGLDVLRMYLQKLTNNDFEWIMRNKIVDGSSVYDLGVKGELAEKIMHTLSSMIKLLGRPSLLNQLRIVRNYMNQLTKLHSEEYPKSPVELPRWIARVENLIEEYARTIGFNRGQKVKW
ncbi:MAG: NAD(P)/FAD-dependent oxidoreductase [Thermosphaera sp.]